MNADYVFNRANCGIIGINEELEVFGGYDNYLEIAHAKPPEFYMCYEQSQISREEKLILADRMISLWERYKKECV